ncbi:MAG: hypothetical protein HY900_08040 [Deltaproteobacteria bacterium]|nr:hypothetical protein [Deltaproteobacteria bacterium]
MRPGTAALAGILLSALLASTAPAPAHGAEETTVLQGSGICYPHGFEVNTVGAVRGKIRGLIQPERGPVRFRLDAGGETYVVLVCPARFWPEGSPPLRERTEVLVRGSKTLGRDRALYLIAQELVFPASGASVKLRDPQGRPLWMGARAPRGPRLPKGTDACPAPVGGGR